jgi:ribulose kinase
LPLREALAVELARWRGHGQREKTYDEADRILELVRNAEQPFDSTDLRLEAERWLTERALGKMQRTHCEPCGDTVIAAYIAGASRTQQAFDSTPLKDFCKEILREVSDGRDFDGADLQELALKYGLLEEVTVNEPCGDACMCNEVVGEFPTTCYRRMEIVK